MPRGGAARPAPAPAPAPAAEDLNQVVSDDDIPF
jgi:hypothetical protein